MQVKQFLGLIFWPSGEKGNAKYNLGKRKTVHHPSSAYSSVYRVSRPGSRGFKPKKEANRGQIVPASEKIPHFGPHKYLILLTLVRCDGVDLPVRDRRSDAGVSHLCRLAAGRFGGGAVKLHMEIG